MFNKYYVNNGKYHVNKSPSSTYSKVDVSENRAPTDESVRLLKEFEAAALNNIIDTVRIQNCDIDCVVQIAYDAMEFSYIGRAMCTINGKKLIVFDSVDKIDSDYVSLYEKLGDKLGREIATHILQKPFIEQLKGVIK